ncbi:MAG: hypothetical protein ABRQ39_11965 [Candidatus Eremiobacterota bacterium]
MKSIKREEFNSSIKNGSVKAHIKFDNFESAREIFFTSLIIIGFLLFCIGFIPESKLLLIFGSVISVISLFIRLTIRETLILDSEKKCVMKYKKILFKEKFSFLCPFSHIKHVKLSDVEYETDAYDDRQKWASPAFDRLIRVKYTLFSVQLVFQDDKIRTYKKQISVSRREEYNSKEPVTILRDYALEIAGLVGCKVIYSEKIPLNERLQPPEIKEIETAQ